MKGPPSSAHVFRAGKRSSRASPVTTSDTGPRRPRLTPIRHRSPATSRAPHNLAGVGGSAVSTSSTSRRINRCGRSPNASSARRAVPNRFVTRGKSASMTFENNSAGPPAATTRRWISATSRTRSTGTVTSIRSRSCLNRVKNARKSGKAIGTVRRPLSKTGGRQQVRTSERRSRRLESRSRYRQRRVLEIGSHPETQMSQPRSRSHSQIRLALRPSHPVGHPTGSTSR